MKELKITIPTETPTEGTNLPNALGISDEQMNELMEKIFTDHEDCNNFGELAERMQSYTQDELIMLVLQFM